MLIILDLLNGNIQNSVRSKQLTRLCNLFNINLLKPVNLNINNVWFAGFFDGDGTIGYSFKKGYPQLIISVSNKKALNYKPFKKIFGGTIRLDSSSNTYKWEIYRIDQILLFANYVNKYSLRSHKKNKFFLLNTFFKLRKARAYAAPTSSLVYKAWVRFEEKWRYN